MIQQSSKSVQITIDQTFLCDIYQGEQLQQLFLFRLNRLLMFLLNDKGKP